MRFMIAVDCEGTACVVGEPEKTLGQSRQAGFYGRQATREADAAARALFDSGAEDVIVWDNHNGSLNLDYDDLDERCRIALGVGVPHRWPGLEADFAGVLLVGYHPMDNVADGVLAHTFSSVSYQQMRINGQEVGEIAIDAAMAGEQGVPVIFVASDDKGAAEAARFLPWCETVATKQGLGRNAALSLHPKRSCRAIYDGVRRAVARLPEMKPFAFEEPLEFEIRTKRLELAQSMERSMTGWERIDPYTLRRRFAKLSDRY